MVRSASLPVKVKVGEVPLAQTALGVAALAAVVMCEAANAVPITAAVGGYSKLNLSCVVVAVPLRPSTWVTLYLIGSFFVAFIGVAWGVGSRPFPFRKNSTGPCFITVTFQV